MKEWSPSREKVLEELLRIAKTKGHSMRLAAEQPKDTIALECSRPGCDETWFSYQWKPGLDFFEQIERACPVGRTPQ